MIDTESPFESVYARTLGDVIRRHRKVKRWTRKRLWKELRELPDGRGVDVSLQTLATYELGTRTLSVIRLAQIAAALRTDAEVITAEVNAVMFPGHQDKQTVAVDLVKLSASARRDIRPAARWAALQLADNPGKWIADLTTDALDQLANVCILDGPELVDVLKEFQAH
jgi:transcriptional regulator with XRE-family HTH domain